MSNEDKDVKHSPLPLTDTTDSPALLDVEAVAHMLGCSTRHVYRLCFTGRMPQPVKLGVLNRWPRAVLQDWIAAGLPDCSEGGDGNVQ